ncbi:hypothetical protein Fcan01_24203 [Folsomia candida]|uniref:Uncharacterized protein n=1 Tax=Folsomia candida TaxID=158441 RepID=A0A226D6N2_FOLCA|nr:hypothetical protein Fcan01_24203 [Folsomia candida]
MVLQYIYAYRRSFTSNFSNPTRNVNPRIYFLIWSDMARIVYRIIVLETLGGGNYFLEILQFLENSKHLACFQYKSWGRATFFLTNNTYTPDWDEIRPIDHFLAIAAIIGVFSRQIIAHFTNIAMLVMAIVLWSGVKGFDNLVASMTDKKQTTPCASNNKELLLNYDALKELSKLINDAISPIFLLFVVEGLLYYSTNINALLLGGSTIYLIRQFMYFIEFVAILLLSGNSCKRMEDAVGMWAYRWLITEETEAYTQKRMNFSVLINDAKSGGVGLSGYIFIMDYTTMLSVSV